MSACGTPTMSASVAQVCRVPQAPARRQRMPRGSRTGQAFALLDGGQLHKIRIPLPCATRDAAMPAGRGYRRGAGHRALRAGLRGDRLAGILTRGTFDVWLFLAWVKNGQIMVLERLRFACPPPAAAAESIMEIAR
jgi:hypothetical protein